MNILETLKSAGLKWSDVGPCAIFDASGADPDRSVIYGRSVGSIDLRHPRGSRQHLLLQPRRDPASGRGLRALLIATAPSRSPAAPRRAQYRDKIGPATTWRCTFKASPPTGHVMATRNGDSHDATIP